MPLPSEFGISITSRHDEASELRELQAFADAATKADLHMFVEEAFYDSNSCCCQFAFRNGLQEGDHAAQKLQMIALETISQFEWFGVICHGRGAPDC